MLAVINLGQLVAMTTNTHFLDSAVNGIHGCDTGVLLKEKEKILKKKNNSRETLMGIFSAVEGVIMPSEYSVFG